MPACRPAGSRPRKLSVEGLTSLLGRHQRDARRHVQYADGKAAGCAAVAYAISDRTEFEALLMRFAKPSEKRTLDLGCGGDGAQPRGREPVVGIDIDLAALTGSRGGRLLVCGRGEQLPFKDASFSHAGSGVALPYMRIPFAVREVFRVLRPGGSVRMSLHPWTMTVSELGRAIRAGNLRNTLFRCYILLNGACFHLTGHMFSFPLKRARLESFQTSGRMTRVLVSAGFEAIHWEKSRQFVVTARKPEV